MLNFLLLQATQNEVIKQVVEYTSRTNDVMFWVERGIAGLVLLCIYKFAPIVAGEVKRMHGEGTKAIADLTSAVNTLNTNMQVNDAKVDQQLQNIQKGVNETKYCALGMARDMKCRNGDMDDKKGNVGGDNNEEQY